MEREYKVSIIYKDKIVETVVVHAISQDDAEDRCFEWADCILSSRHSDFDTTQVELFFRDNPRHQILFQGVDQ